MNFSDIGYAKYSDQKPESKQIAECIDEHGVISWTAQIGPYGGAGPMPYWWRPALSKDFLWRQIIKLLRRPVDIQITVEGGGGLTPP